MSTFPMIRQFCNYYNRVNTHFYVGYHTEFLNTCDEDDFYEKHSIVVRDLDNERPLFLHPTLDITWQNFNAPCETKGVVLEVTFEIKQHQIHLCETEEEYRRLIRLCDFIDHRGRYEEEKVLNYYYTEACKELITKGKRWFLLLNQEEGKNESFIAYSKDHVFNVDFPQYDAFGNSICPPILQLVLNRN